MGSFLLILSVGMGYHTYTQEVMINRDSVSEHNNSNSESNSDSDQWVLNQLVLRKPKHQALITVLKPRHIYNAFPVFNSTFYDHVSNFTLVSKLWEMMKLPVGDEQLDSVIVHFAGLGFSFMFNI